MAAPTGLGFGNIIFAERYPWSGPIDYLPRRNLDRRLEELTRNITLGIFSLHKVAVQQDMETKLSLFTTRLSYSYDRKALILTYSIAFSLGLLGIVVGAMPFRVNGVSRDAGFLTILATTRDQDLDRLATGICLGTDGSMDHLRDVKIRFGEIRAAQQSGALVSPQGTRDVGHAGFGIEGTIDPLRYRRYYNRTIRIARMKRAPFYSAGHVASLNPRMQDLQNRPTCSTSAFHHNASPEPDQGGMGVLPLDNLRMHTTE